MKTTKLFSTMMAVILLSFSINSCDKPIPKGLNYKNHTITLYVDTDNINQQNIDSTCNFNQDKQVSNKDYTTEVYLGDDITWEGTSSSPTKTGTVKIKKIRYISGAEILNKKVKSNSLFSPKVRAKVKKGKPEDIEKYSIEFKVVRNGKRETFIIDPKLQVVQ